MNRLSPQLTGKAQQVYAAMPTMDASQYDDAKVAVLRRYNINVETYHQHLHEAWLKEMKSGACNLVPGSCEQVDDRVQFC